MMITKEQFRRDIMRLMKNRKKQKSRKDYVSSKYYSTENEYTYGHNDINSYVFLFGRTI